jgi:hypothetical protein
MGDPDQNGSSSGSWTLLTGHVLVEIARNS